MLPPGLETPSQVKQYYNSVYDRLIDSGEYIPFIYPWFSIGFGIVLIYLLIDHRKRPWLKALRFPLFGLLCACSAWCISTMRARSPAAQYGVGLLSAWGTLWTATVMFFNDCQTDFRRIQYRDSVGFGQIRQKPSGEKRGAETKSWPSLEYDEDKAWRREYGPMIWQSYPTTSFIERLDWILDVFSNFRGLGWNYQTSDIPSFPAWVTADLKGEDPPVRNTRTNTSDITLGKTGLRRFTSRRALLWYCLVRLTLGYLALDLIKTLMHHDAYFWGYTHAAPAPSYLPTAIAASPILVKSLRLAISFAAIYTALHQILRCGPLVFAVLLGPRVLGARGHAFMNPPDFYGSFVPNVLDRGLAGFWGGYWHQTFRVAFAAPATRALAYFAIAPRGQLGKIIAMFVAFGSSALLHFCGSTTQLGVTRPFRGAAMFFLVQPLGILVQTYAVLVLGKLGIAARTPQWLSRVVNGAFVLVFLYHSAPLLVDDFAEGGVWLYEPIPFSPLRALGFGARDDRSWDLWFGLVSWRNGKTWWDTGIAF